jgi:hypothetical protein
MLEIFFGYLGTITDCIIVLAAPCIIIGYALCEFLGWFKEREDTRLKQKLNKSAEKYFGYGA